MTVCSDLQSRKQQPHLSVCDVAVASLEFSDDFIDAVKPPGLHQKSQEVLRVLAEAAILPELL